MLGDDGQEQVDSSRIEGGSDTRHAAKDLIDLYGNGVDEENAHRDAVVRNLRAVFGSKPGDKTMRLVVLYLYRSGGTAVDHGILYNWDNYDESRRIW